MLLIAALLATGEVRAQQSTAPAFSPADSPVAPAPAPTVIAPPAPVSAQEGITRPRARHTKGDPLEGLNRKLFSFHQRADKAFFRPLALLYKHIIPKPLRTAMRHILSNLGEPLVFMNDLLQLKPKRAAKTLTRFVINSSIGVGGIVDIAKTTDLPHHDNSLGDTLARYGVGPGPYLFIPFYGPTDVRDLLGGQAENLIYPLAIGEPFDRTDYQISAGLVAGLDLRAESDADFKALLDGAADPYATLRSVFQQSRAAEIAEIKGKQPAPGLDDPLTDPDAMAHDAGADTPVADSASPDTATPPSTDASPVDGPADAPAVDAPASQPASPATTGPAPTAPADAAPTKTPSMDAVPQMLMLYAL